MNFTKAYNILKIKENSSTEEIKSAYRKLSLQHHPDRNLNSDSKNVFLQIKQAYNFILNLKGQDGSENKALDQPSPNEFKLELTLEEIFTGCIKNEKIICKVTDQTGIEKLKEKVLNVVIKPGVLTGTRITIYQEGDRRHGEMPANVVFTLHDKAHETFKRDRFNLKYTATISAEEAILGCELTIPTLDNDKLILAIDEPITHKTVKRIPNRGFPYPDSSNKRGDLVVLFNIITQIKNIEKDVYLTIAQAKNGCSKNVLINSKIANIDRTENFEDKIVSIDIKPETQFGTKITFLEEGDQNESGKRSDVVFVVCEQPKAEHEEQPNKSDSDLYIYYKELNIPIGSSIQVINEAYQALMNGLNTFPGNKFNSFKKSMKIAEAYSQLMKIKFEEGNDKLYDNSVSSEDEEILVKKQAKLSPNKFNLKLYLEEIYKGCTKQQKITTTIVNRDGTEKQQEKSIKVDVKPGSVGGTEMILPFEGDACYGKINADVIFTVIEEPHDIFKRNEYDIEFTAQITPKEAILGGKIIVQTLENKTFEHTFKGGIAPDTVQRIPRRGLPIFEENNKFGDLIIKFDIIFDDDPVNKTDDIPKEKLPPNTFNMKLTLDEIHTGCIKHQTVTITNILKNGNKTIEEKQLKIDVKPGSISGTKISVLNEGNICYGKLPADVIFNVREETHSLFRRKGYDLEYIPKVKITQKQAIFGGKLSIPTLEDEPFEWTFKGGITQNTVQRIQKRGLPVLNEKNQFGDMLVKCEVMFDQDPAIEREIEITLEQILNGCTKKLKIKRVMLDSQGNEVEETKVLILEIKPGTSDGTQFTFPREGDQRPGRIAADIVFIVRDKPHDTFTRNGVDIEHTITITKSQFSNGSPLQIPTLANDGPKYVSLDGLEENNPFRKIRNCGLPFPDKPGKRGDLLVRFNIEEDPQNDPIFRDLELSYEQILSGWTKKLKIKSRIFDNYGNEILTKENIIEIVVEKGAHDGTEIKFEKLGDKYPGIIPADIIFVVRYKDHPFFERNGYDIYYTAVITRNEAQNGIEFEIPTLEDIPLLLTIKKGVTVCDVQRFDNLGLPFYGDTDKRGDLIVQYNIVDNKFKDREIKHPLPLSLEKILEGGEMKLKIKRVKLDHEGIIVYENKVIVINILPGTKSGKKFTFSRHGDNLDPERIPADVVFKVKEKPHDKFKRNGNDIEYTAYISGEQARCGCVLEIPTLENVTRLLTIDRYITENSTRRLKNGGLPDSKYTYKRGDIIVGFKIIENSDNKIEENKLNENSKLKQEYNNSDESSSFVLQSNIIPQDEDVEYYLPVSLENILHGCTKQMKITRKIFDETKNQFEEREKIVKIELKPGTKTGKRKTFSKAGDKNLNSIPADVVFIVQEEKHPDFTRKGADLLHTAQLTEQKYLAGHKLMIPTLEGGYVPLEIFKSFHNINEIMRIPAHGLPVPDNPAVRGDIIVSFQIVENINQAFVHRKVMESKTNIQDQQQIICLPLRLEAILIGFTDKTTIDKLVTLKDGTLSKQKQLVNFTVYPGTEYGTFIYPTDETGKYCSDVVFKITEIKHKYFKRRGADIEYTSRITTEKALTGGSIQYHTLEGGMKWLKLKAPINTETIKILPNLGLPCLQNINRRGNLLIRFEIYEN